MNQPKVITASCHCGAIQLTADHEPPSVTECNCSICRRYGARWAYFDRSTARVDCAPGSLVAYLWGDQEIEFLHCKTCGCLTHYESVEKAEKSRLAINTRMMSPEDIDHIPTRRFDGAKTWKFLED